MRNELFPEIKNMHSSHEVSQSVSIIRAEVMAVLASTILSALYRAWHIVGP